MGLQRQMPFRMAQTIVDGSFQILPVFHFILNVARLQTEYFSIRHAGIFINLCIIAFIDDFQFVNMWQDDTFVFWRTCYPVHTASFGQRSRTVGFHLHKASLLVEPPDKECGNLQSWFSAGYDDMLCRETLNLRNNLFFCHFRKRRMVGVAERTS